ncbi:hypothetical protein J1G43_13895 [Cellulomonas sp. zg-ZUI22]|uniref:hypothetical protein n=1 Tax=Cellulomonas sp. zg-ZUI22 TaxID=2816955 RepID=UPI001A93D7C4|nr:hypothetical protein [Cellulomonas sp. zg-ZUI22]MBO0901056.1 hypothetical protein [Cellulomonas sp. zg-ZUI22]
MSSPLDHAFTAPLEKDGALDTSLTVPDSHHVLGTGRAMKVAAGDEVAVHLTARRA